MNKKTKGIIIDIMLLVIYGFILMFGIYVLYDNFPTLSRLVAMLLIFISIPITWGTAILSFMGKKTIGHRLADKNKANAITYIILSIIFVLIIFLYVWYLFLYTYRELPIVDCDYYAKAEQYAEITNYYGIKSVKKGKIITKEKIIDTSILGRKKIKLIIENNYGKKREYQYFINIVEGVEKCELSFRDINDNLLMDKGVLKEHGARISQDSFGNPAVSLTVKNKDKFFEITNKISKQEDNMIVIWINFDENNNSYEKDKNNCGSKESNCLSAAVVSQGFSSDVIIPINDNKIVDCINNSWN